MPEIQGACPCGATCAACQPADYAGGGGGAGGAIPLIPAPPFPSLYSMTDVFQELAYGYAAQPYRFYRIGSEVPEAAVSQAQQREMERQQEEYARAAAEQARARTEAWERAERLLLRWLSPGQARDYRERGWFDVAGSDGHRWRIVCQGQTGNVQLLNARGEWTHAYCAHPRGRLPDPAGWLAQAMAIAHDAAGFRRIANVYSTARAAEETACVTEPAPAAQARMLAALRNIRPGWIR
jgi:hypothetical protein